MNSPITVAEIQHPGAPPHRFGLASIDYAPSPAMRRSGATHRGRVETNHCEHNPEYARGPRRLIHVTRQAETSHGAAAGLLVVALDDDQGRTLGLRYPLRRGAPDVVHVGCVLALLLRQSCREFRSYAIRTP